MSAEKVEGVKKVFKEIRGIYRKRIMGVRQAFFTKEEFEARVDAAGLKKLAKMLRILGFLAQTKVYLFWKILSFTDEDVYHQPYDLLFQI